MSFSVAGASATNFDFRIFHEDFHQINALLGTYIEELLKYYEANGAVNNTSSIFDELVSRSRLLDDMTYTPYTLGEFFEGVRKYCPYNKYAQKIERIFNDDDWMYDRKLCDDFPLDLLNKIVILAILAEKNELVIERLIPTYYVKVPLSFVEAAVAKENSVMIEYLSRCTVYIPARL